MVSRGALSIVDVVLGVTSRETGDAQVSAADWSSQVLVVDRVFRGALPMVGIILEAGCSRDRIQPSFDAKRYREAGSCYSRERRCLCIGCGLVMAVMEKVSRKTEDVHGSQPWIEVTAGGARRSKLNALFKRRSQQKV